ncbi:MAG: M23 family metallopeptidase, partial [Candidatus Buchananbacteria bacterium]|nr:M23 family metallopeptidase [Candidatus Buchananbacteria bacterium]
MAGTSVKSAADGKVMFAQARGTCVDNWVYLIIIEHMLPDGKKVCTLYGHTKPVGITEGQWVNVGQKIGEVISASCWSDHLHFGVYNGSYGVSVGQYPAWAKGYASQSVWPENYLEPSLFIADHLATTVLPGQLSDGTVNQRIVSCYNQFSSVVGNPFDNGGGAYVHDWYSQDGRFYVTIQDFRNSNNEYFAIIDNPDVGQAFLLQGGFRWYYTSQVDGPAYFGAPTTNELAWQHYPWVNGSFDTSKPKVMYKRQEFVSGAYLLWQFGTSKVIAVDGTGGGFDIAILPAFIPGDGQTLTLWAQALSPTEVSLTNNEIIGATE